MVEFALVLPIWLLILALVFMTAWLGYLQLTLERAAFEGAKAGAIFPGNDDQKKATAQTRAQEAVPFLQLTSEDVTATIQPAVAPIRPKIVVTPKYRWTAPFSFGLPATFDLQATAVATIEPEL